VDPVVKKEDEAPKPTPPPIPRPPLPFKRDDFKSGPTNKPSAPMNADLDDDDDDDDDFKIPSAKIHNWGELLSGDDDEDDDAGDDDDMDDDYI
jgi:hypothetical protein